MPNDSFYWSDYYYNGKLWDLSHLDPFVFEFSWKPEKGPKLTFKIRVKFNNHCFVDHFVEGVDPEAHIVWDHEYKRDDKYKRALSQERYDLSKGLPELILKFPELKVFETHQGNYMSVSAEDGTEAYRIFFTLEKANPKKCPHTGENTNLEMYVESAYRRPNIDYKNKWRFSVLCKNTLEGKQKTRQPGLKKFRR